MKNILLVILIGLAGTCTAQKQANIWHFGDGQCIDFSNGAPVSVTGSQIFAAGAPGSYSDKFGNLLFYTNGGGDPFGTETGRIWNRNNAVMYDMLGIQGGGIRTIQSSVVFEAPGQDSVYYVFTMEDQDSYLFLGSTRGLSYFTVDMRLNGGLGGVVMADVPVHAPSIQGLCAVRHANGSDYWVIIYQDSIGLGVYSVTQNGGVTLANTYTGAGTYGLSSGSLGLIKSSPNGEYVAALLDLNSANLRIPYLMRFDNSTGQLSLPIQIPTTTTNLGNTVSFEFSPNSRFLYTIQADSATAPPLPQRVVQYDLQAPNIITSAQTLYSSSLFYFLAGLQLAPDGKIYFINFGVDSLGNIVNNLDRITCPNTTAASIDFDVFTYSNFSNGAPPNYPAWLFENYDSTYVALGPDTVDLCDVGGSYALNALNPGATYLWSTGATTQSITVNTPGTYSVTVTGDCGTGNDRVVVVNCNTTTSPVNCDTTGNWFLFGNYDGGKLNIIVDQNIPNLKIGICTYEPVIVTFSGPFVGNITDVYYAGTNSSAFSNPCGFPITTTSFVGVNSSLTTVDVIPPVNIISPPNPANIGNQPNGFNFGVIGVFSCDVNTYQGGANTIDQVVDVFQTRFGGSLRGLKVQYCCWSDTLPYSLSNVTGSCCNTTPGIATLSYPPGPFCSGSGQVVPTLLGDSSGTFFANPSGLIINTNTGVIDVTGSSPGTYEVFYALTENCITNFFNDTIVISSASNSNTSISASACSSYTAPWGTVYTQSGTYKDTLTNVSGCDSIISVNLTITGTIITPSITASACSSYTASWGTVYTQTGIYRDTLTSVNGCDSIISVNLTITGTIITPPIIASACTSYSAPWGTVYTQSGTYTDTLTSVNGCDSIVSVNLTITGTIITPTITASACTSYTAPWGTVYTQSGTYRDTLSTVNGCDSIVSVNLTVLGNVIAPTLTASACSTYTAPWGAIYSQSGTYRDTLSAANGCDSIVSVNLTINSLPSLSASSNPDICGRKTGTASASASSGSGGYIYAWSTGVSGSSLINVGSGVYTVTVTDQRGCSASTSITVGNIPPPLVNVTSSSSPIILEGDSVQLNATGALSFLWSPAIGLSCTACPSTVASPPQTTTYVVTAADTNGCIGSDSITVRVDIRCDELFVPSAFSPNNAGPAINERVCVFSNCIAEMNFAIYSRWGQLIFQTSDPLQCWDGTKDEKEVMSGVYVYRLSVKQLNGISITKNGNITLVR